MTICCSRCGRDVEHEDATTHEGQAVCFVCLGEVRDGVPVDLPPLKRRSIPHSQMPSGARGDVMPKNLTLRASDMLSSSVLWLWEARLALGYLSVQTGIEGIGKSVFVAWLIAKLTHGDLPGEFVGKPVSVLLVAGEDGINDTWLPRLELAQADPQYVHFLNLAELPAGWNVRDGIAHVREAMKRSEARFVFFDALLDHMPDAKGGETINSPTFVRKALAPLRGLFREEARAAALYSLHPPKARAASFRDLVQASQAFGAIPRTGLYFDYHPEDADMRPRDRRRVLVRGKGNLGADPDGLTFRVIGKSFKADDGRTTERELVTDVESEDISFAALLAESSRDQPKADQAAEFVKAALADGEWHESQPLMDGLAAIGISQRTTRRARETVGAEVRKRPGELDGPWEWRLESKGPSGLPGARARARDVSPGLAPSPENPPESLFPSEGVNWPRVSKGPTSDGGGRTEGAKSDETPRARPREEDWPAMKTALDAVRNNNHDPEEQA